jgi:azurin
MNYVPKTPKVLFHTRLVPPATTESIYFVAPLKSGDYTYLCTVPGHSQIMRGVLRVVGEK